MSGGDVRQAAQVVEFSLGLSWHGGGPPAWEELARRADVALADSGWTRTAEWTHHLWPGPIAQARVGKRSSPPAGAENGLRPGQEKAGDAGLQHP
jgi:hypothetical protein